MNSTTEKLFNSFIEMCESMVHETYVITDGQRVVTATLDHEMANKICELTQRNTNDDTWKVLSIPHAVSYAFRVGYYSAMMKNQTGEEARESELAPEKNGDVNEDQKLRECDIQQSEEED